MRDPHGPEHVLEPERVDCVRTVLVAILRWSTSSSLFAVRNHTTEAHRKAALRDSLMRPFSVSLCLGGDSMLTGDRRLNCARIVTRIFEAFVKVAVAFPVGFHILLEASSYALIGRAFAGYLAGALFVFLP
jgi:hypothetical protein